MFGNSLDAMGQYLTKNLSYITASAFSEEHCPIYNAAREEEKRGTSVCGNYPSRLYGSQEKHKQELVNYAYLLISEDNASHAKTQQNRNEHNRTKKRAHKNVIGTTHIQDSSLY